MRLTPGAEGSSKSSSRMTSSPRAPGPMPLICRTRRFVLHFCHMSHTLTIRLSKELADWLEETSARTGVSQGRLVRDQLERARAGGGGRSFMRLAGRVRGPRNLSARKGFSTK